MQEPGHAAEAVLTLAAPRSPAVRERRILTAPPERGSRHTERTASRPRLAARAIALVASNRFARSRPFVAAASRGRLAVRPFPDTPF